MQHYIVAMPSCHAKARPLPDSSSDADRIPEVLKEAQTLQLSHFPHKHRS